MDDLKVYTNEDSISVKKPNGTEVDYFIFDEYEIHLNKIPPHSVQEWHRHRKIDEALIMTSGEICLKWIDDGKESSRIITKGMVVRMGRAIHTLENNTDVPAEFNIVRTVPQGKDNREIIKNDKIVGKSNSALEH